MADTVKVFCELSCLFNGDFSRFGSVFDPGSVTLGSDRYSKLRTEVPTETATALNAPSTAHKFAIYIPSVAGILSWYKAGVTAATSSIKLRADYPFILPTQTHSYDSDLLTRLAFTPGNIVANSIYFYQTSGSDAYVDVYTLI